MKITTNDGATNYAHIFNTDGYDWHFIVREGGSISVYGTRTGESYHTIIFDTLDNAQPSKYAKEIISEIIVEAHRLRDFVQAADRLEGTIKNGVNK